MAKKPPALTPPACARLAPRDQQYEVYDGATRGLMLRVFPSGLKRWYFRAREDGRLRLFVVGSYPELSLLVARKRAGQLRAKLDAGENPTAESDARRAEPSLNELFADYQARHAKSERSKLEDARRWGRHVRSRFGARRAGAVEPEEIARMLHHIATRSGPYESNRTLALLRHLYTWGATVRVLRCANPCAGLPPQPETPRERTLTPAETRRLLQAIAAEPDLLWQGYFLLVALTGCRRTELLSARWEWVRLDHVPPVLVLPRTTTKQRREHSVPLSSLAVQVVEQLPSRGSSAWLFPSDAGGHRIEVKRVWTAIRERARLEDIHLHDLRHLVGSSLGSANENAFLIARALGHSQISTTQRYVHPELDATHRALEDHGERLRALQEKED